MSDVLITSSLLILALLLLRRVFRGAISRRLQYALWALVLVRLLIPGSLPGLPSDLSVLTAARPVREAVERRTNMHIFYSDPVREMTPEALLERNIAVEEVPTADDGAAMILAPKPEQDGAAVPQQEGYLVRDPETDAVTLYADMSVGPWEILDAVWKAGMVLMAAWFAVSNARFYWKLRKHRAVYDAPSRRRVYLVDEGVLPSPCLFGGAIYLTPAAVEDPGRLRHVLTHEETHARHLDPLWSLLRCVCLTVYWFDPLVWIAAECSKTDCELACDEGALARLGEDERIPYGRTLLSLIPVKKGPGDPMISATTMTAGKKQLKDRITRIAQNPRQVMAAVLAAAVLATAAAACTFTGASVPSETPAESAAPVEVSGPVSLTGAELEWFNTEFFNSAAGEKTGREPYVYFGIGRVEYYNIRNQFANPINLYDRPEDIDLYELFYLEGSAPSDEEIGAAFDMDPGDLPCPAYKLTPGEMDAVLTQYTGTTLAQSSQIGVENFSYQESGGAYYWAHGDTNYCGELDFLYGTRETTGEGTFIRLYHSSDFAGTGWYCVTLSDRGDGEYWFVSNQECGHPAIPPVTPAGDPDAAISLEDLEPYVAGAVELENRPESDFDGSSENRLENWNFDDHHVMVYKAVDGMVRSAVERDDGNLDVFAQYSFDDVEMDFFQGLFGRDGFTVTYRPGANARFYATDTDYYYFDENGVLALLARCHGDSQSIDLDGDGQNELIAPRQMFFLRDGLVYEAELDELLLDECQGLDYWDYESWDVYSRCLYVNGLTDWNAGTGAAMWERYLYFDGENILVYRDEKPTADHMVEGADAGVPDEVAEQARAYVEGLLSPQADGAWLRKDREQDSEYNYVIDDWRIESFPRSSSDVVGDAVIEGWAFNYELHTPDPEKVMWAGGMYVTEDGWVSPGYPGCDWLFFHDEDGKLTFLEHAMINDMSPGSSAWRQYIEDMAEGKGVDIGEKSYAAVQFESDLDYLFDRSGGQIILSFTASADGLGGTYVTDPNDGSGPYCRRQLTDPENYLWYRLDDDWTAPEGDSVILARPDWGLTIQFWLDGEAVMVKYSNQEPKWYKAESLWDPADVFYDRSTAYYQVRSWFDQLELEAARADHAIIVDRQGLSQLDVAQEWAEYYEQAMVHLSPGGSYTCTYVDVTDVEVIPNTQESWFSGEAALYPHFAFSYSTIFVPENENARNNLMAGNTAAYEGNGPGVPDGAFQYWRFACLYRSGDGWRCYSVGTGP